MTSVSLTPLFKLIDKTKIDTHLLSEKKKSQTKTRKPRTPTQQTNFWKNGLRTFFKKVDEKNLKQLIRTENPFFKVFLQKECPICQALYRVITNQHVSYIGQTQSLQNQYDPTSVSYTFNSILDHLQKQENSVNPKVKWDLEFDANSLDSFLKEWGEIPKHLHKPKKEKTLTDPKKKPIKKVAWKKGDQIKEYQFNDLDQERIGKKKKENVKDDDTASNNSESEGEEIETQKTKQNRRQRNRKVESEDEGEDESESESESVSENENEAESDKENQDQDQDVDSEDDDIAKEKEKKKEILTHHCLYSQHEMAPVSFLPPEKCRKLLQLMEKIQNPQIRKKKGKQKVKTKAERELQIFKTQAQLCRFVAKSLLENVFNVLPQNNLWKPRRHQQHFANWVQEKEGQNIKNVGAVLYNGACASGKTTGSLYALLPLPFVQKIRIITTNSMIDYWVDEVLKIWDTDNRKEKFKNEIEEPIEITIMGYNMLERDCYDTLTSKGEIRKKSTIFNEISNSYVILDEGQQLRNGLKSDYMINALYVLQYSLLTLILTGTPLINNPIIETPSLIAMMKGPFPEAVSLLYQTDIPTKKLEVDLSKKSKGKIKQKEFNLPIRWRNVQETKREIDEWYSFFSKEANRPKTKKGLQLSPAVQELLTSVFKGRTFFYNPEIHDPLVFKSCYPPILLEEVRVPMSVLQSLCYLQTKNAKWNFGPFSFKSYSNNRYQSLSRKIVTYCNQENKSSSKIEKVVQNVFKFQKYGKQVIKSRFIDDGIQRVENALRNHPDFEQSLFSIEKVIGKTDNSKRQKIFAKYNSGKCNLLLLGDVGTLGIDLHGTYAMHQLDREQNTQLEIQANRRVSRFSPGNNEQEEKSMKTKKAKKNENNKTEEKERKPVTIYKYISTFPIDMKCNDKNRQLIYDFFTKFRMTKEEFEQEKIDVCKELVVAMKQEGKTIDETVEDNNEVKQKDLLPYLNFLISVAMQVEIDAENTKE